MITDEMKLWNEKKLKLKKTFPYLTDEDLKFEPGKQAQMLEKLQITLGKTKGDLTDYLNSL